MFSIKIADLIIGIDEKYDYVKKFCKDYIVQSDVNDFCAKACDDDIEKEYLAGSGRFSKPYCESICIYREICKRLPDYDAFLLHAAVIELDGKSYAFTAKSGTGKSTHIKLWQKVFGQRCRIINGDKPIIRKFGDSFFACGTPWCGKENWQTNAISPLVGLCFLERGAENSISNACPDEILSRIFHQLFVPQNIDSQNLFFALLDDFLKKTPSYILRCNMDESAALTAFEGMNPHPDST
ncbi:MAG: hypothetical protein IJO29_07000 [Oscillospiraceae bacterium]|nr:hypothetical protein [Oscillospiraceae bacterium]